MTGTLCIRLLCRNNTDIIEELMPETAIEQMQRRMLHTAVIPVNRAPVFHGLFRSKRLIVMRIHIAQEVPGRTCPLRHGIGFTFCRTAAARTGRVDPFGNVGKRRMSVIRRFIAFYLGKQQREILFIQRNSTAFRAMYNRNRFAPIALTGEHPVTELKVDLCFADSLFCQE